MNVSQLVAVCIPLFFLDKVGRRPWLIGSSAAMTTSHVIVSIMIVRFAAVLSQAHHSAIFIVQAKFAYDWAGHQGAAYVGVAFIFTFIFSCTSGTRGTESRNLLTISRSDGLGWGPLPVRTTFKLPLTTC